MIPKIIHFIWIGENVPAWGNNAIENYKIANPLFAIKTWHYENLHVNEQYLNYALPIFINSLNDFVNSKQQPNIDIYNNENQKRLAWLCFLQMKYVIGKKENQFILKNKEYSIDNIPNKLYSIIGDCLKFLILQNEGGIYLDLDTFPIKPFDSELLSNDFFMCYKDVYFLGAIQHEIFWYTKTFRLSHNPIVKMFDIYQKPNKELNIAFYNCFLKCNDDLINKNVQLKYQYIYHFANRSWLFNHS